MSVWRRTLNSSAPTSGEDAVSLTTYRSSLEQAYEKQSEAYDKAIVALSGGALGVSMTFLHEIVPAPRTETLWLLGAAWGAFAVSILAILISQLTGQWAIRKAMRQVDLGTIYLERPGSWFGRLTAILNILAAAGFVTGIVLLTDFSLKNLALIPHVPKS